MFAMGGNAEAIISGLASEDQCRRIIETALARQKEFSHVDDQRDAPPSLSERILQASDDGPAL